MTIIMLITIGFQPSEKDWAQESLSNIFTPLSIRHCFPTFAPNRRNKATLRKLNWRGSIDTAAQHIFQITLKNFSFFEKTLALFNKFTDVIPSQKNFEHLHKRIFCKQYLNFEESMKYDPEF